MSVVGFVSVASPTVHTRERDFSTIIIWPERSRYEPLKFRMTLVDRSSLYKCTITNVLNLAQAQNKIIFVKNTSYSFALC